ncbi:LLM class flavin-dependent oxidoreductase [Kibdelosporangium philippinense]|uniref:LLM class flavin-dependent oxidoreductase n=1 Tax=Kibdelosporangium philippinense TaxID=211113 RepID=A0ABS8Z3F4_9PSEU|nr:LLM class flavin-dependent oxidoreductase [Kibdelosporangium philippinense]MCE7002461.1 LLM class flavin-dependent oxidoreductase [Kibdelosporangium philippinense]
MEIETHLGVALDGAGWHPAAWREPDARPAELFTAGYWADLVREAESGLLDFVTIEDSFSARSSVDDRLDRVYGRLDATLIAAAVAPRTSGIGLIPVVIATHTEPFHISKAIATLDYASSGRAGYQVRISARPDEFAHVGRRETGELPDLLAEAADHVEVVRRLWDSWDDDAEIRDAPTGRFVDRDRLHYIDFEGRWFSVKGPSITPRPPQGQPLVVALAHTTPVYQFAARSADVVVVTPRDPAHAKEILAEVHGESETLRVFGDLVVFLDETTAKAADRVKRLNERDGGEFTSDAAVFAGTTEDLADLVLELHSAGLNGVRLRPGALPHDLVAITRGLVPQLQARGAFRRGYREETLRARLGLARPVNRYAGVAR